MEQTEGNGINGAVWHFVASDRSGTIGADPRVLDLFEVPLPDLVPGLARGQASGRLPSDDDKLARMAAAVIKRLNGIYEETVAEDEPLFEVEDLGEDELRGRELEVSLREDVAHEYSRMVDRMIKNLAEEDGITGVIREDREVLLVTTPGWNTAQLEEWVTRYLQNEMRLRSPGGRD